MRCFKYLKLKSVCLGLRCLFVVLSLESFDTAGRIDEFLLASKERMAFRADFKVDLWLGRAGLKGFAAGAFHDRIDVVRMDICFHQASKWLRNSLMFRAAALTLRAACVRSRSR